MKHEIFSENSDAEEAEGHYVVAESTSASEVIFGAQGPMCHANGWCVIPQQRVGKRLPGVHRREVIKWSQYQEERPAASLVDRWAKPCFNENVAMILGSVSGNVFALDIDIKDWDFASAVEKIAFSILGKTLFQRIGSAPKRALFYRVATAEELPANLSRYFVDNDGESASEHGFEILSQRKMITIYGRHHESYARFTWNGGCQPALATPDEVPLVTPAQIEAFMAAVERVRPFHRARSASGGHVFDLATIEHDGTIRTPKLDQARGWSVNADKKVSGGREAYLWELCRLTVALNAGLGVEELKAVALKEALAKMLIDGVWEPKLVREISDKIGRAHRALLDGTLPPIAAGATSIGASGFEQVEAATGYDTTSLGWLPGLRSKIPTKKLGVDRSRAQEFASSLAIAASAEEVRDRQSAMLSRGVRDYLQLSWDAVERVDGGEKPVIVKPGEAAPTDGVAAITMLFRNPAGAGKTTRTISEIARWKDPFKPRPILFLTPTYENAKEVVAAAVAQGLTVVLIEGEIRSGREDEKLRAAGGEPEVPGCWVWRQKQMLVDAGLGSSPMCRTKLPPKHGEEEGEEVLCRLYGLCRSHRARAAVATADLVVAVHAYVVCNKPAELDACKLVIIDEAISDQITGTMKLTLSDLERPRGVKLTKHERKAGLTPQDFIDSRDVLAVLVARELKAGRDPARLFTHNKKHGNRLLTELLTDTIAVVGRSEDVLGIRPEMDIAAVERLCQRPTRTKAVEEATMWRMIKSRVEGLAKDLTNASLTEVSGSNAPAPARNVHGRTDRRIHLYRDGTIRLAYRREYNFSGCHLLLLDASADPVIVEKTLGRAIEMREEDAPMRLRTVYMPGRSFSKSSLLPRDDDTVETTLRKAEDFVRLREAISTIAGFHVGGVLVVLPKAVREILQKGWTRPANVSYLHFSNTKGLNFASRYDAVITIGCIQPSAEAVDGKVAALTWDSDEQEPMIDEIGAGREEDDPKEDFVQLEREIRMRDGRRLSVKQRLPRHPIAQAVYEQVREQEQIQAISRVRPILRDEIPSYYCIGDYVPASIVVDEVMPFEDLHKNFGRTFEEARRSGAYLGYGYVADEDKEAGKLTVAHLAGNARAGEVLIQARHVKSGKTVWAPAYNRVGMERLADDGVIELIHVPAEVEIGRPSTWDADRDIHAVRDIEEAEVELAQEVAQADGWTKPEVGKRTLVRIIDGEIVAKSDMWTVLHLYARMLEPPAPDNDNADAEGIPIPIAA
ncbi:bifunctional DNA primase/polymerase [Aurantimonas sp. A2-1-M11]|uniref:bifunctional DNA primase/polymerase n=1 Tax=Aurantimonas sp. A2-1-M11 TaxID=3113712 RepID=UPI002F95D0EA